TLGGFGLKCIWFSKLSVGAPYAKALYLIEVFMSNLVDSVLPIPISSASFENIVVDYCKLKYRREVVKYGRSGQVQHGVDIFLNLTQYEHIAIQCKNYQNGLLFKTIIDEIEKTASYPTKIDTYIIATSAPRDKKLQDEISKYNKGCNKRFCVELIYWDDITSLIVNDEFIFKKHFPELFNLTNTDMNNKKEDVKAIERILSCVELDMFDSYISAAPDYVSSKFMSSVDVFENEIRSPAFLLHNKNIQQKIGEFFVLWEHIHYGMNGLNGYNCFFYQNAGDCYRFDHQNAKDGNYQEFKDVFQDLHNKCYEMVDLIHKEYPSINIRNLSDQARKTYDWIY
ncbi:hypothetical protein Q4568_23740, partial [Photobacterium sanguinicancri]|nr:hypothetical protein [Photobacterium sanguinicancri]